jgi:hypothetical protein
MKNFEDILRPDADDLDLFENDKVVLSERLLRKGAALVLKSTEKRYATQVNRYLSSARQKLRNRPADTPEESQRRQNDALVDICSALSNLSDQLAVNTNMSLTAILLSERNDKMMLRLMKKN